MPTICLTLIQKYLALVHAFTAVGLEAQATAYSYENGTIRYLALLLQENRTFCVSDKPSAHPLNPLTLSAYQASTLQKKNT